MEKLSKFDNLIVGIIIGLAFSAMVCIIVNLT
jgi:tetrahydromethanopterin S-methyltransferase subunit B